MDGKSHCCDWSACKTKCVLMFRRTALHWACKRDHISIIRYLIANGADLSIKTFKDESAASLASSEEALLLLDCPLEEMVERLMMESQKNLPIVPHYLKNPPFPYGEMGHHDVQSALDNEPLHIIGQISTMAVRDGAHTDDRESEVRTLGQESGTTGLDAPLVLKVRVHKGQERDFVEVELACLTYQALQETCAEELEIPVTRIAKIRKLPNVLVRKDCDVQRMGSGQELEVVLI